MIGLPSGSPGKAAWVACGSVAYYGSQVSSDRVLPRWVPLWVLLALYGKWLHTAMGYRFGKLVGLPELPKYCGRVGYSTHCYAMSYQFGKLVGLPNMGGNTYGSSATNVGAKNFAK